LLSRFHQSPSHPVSAKALAIFMDRQQGEGPGSRTGEILGGRQSRLEKMSRRAAQSGCLERPMTVPKPHRERPWQSSEPIFSATPVIGKKIAKSIGGRTERIDQEG